MNYHVDKSKVIRWIEEEVKRVEQVETLDALARLHQKVKYFQSFPTNFGNSFSDTWDIEASTKEEAACKRAQIYYDGLWSEGNEIPENIPSIMIYFNKSPRLWVKVQKQGREYIAIESSF